MLDECDNAGLIELDLEIAEVLTGFPYTIADVRETYKNRLFQITEDVWFIPKFIYFQYPKGLSNTDNVTKNVVNKLQKYSLLTKDLDLLETYRISNIDIQVIDKDMDMVKEEVKEKAQPKNKFKIIPPTIEMVKERFLELNYSDQSEKFFNYYESNGWKVGKNKMVDWSAAIINWNKNNFNNKPNGTITETKRDRHIRETEAVAELIRNVTSKY